MSMAVVEAMQLGLVPVVTNVGEISNYCRHGDNSIIVQKEQDTDSIDSILRLLNDPAKFSQMSYAAAEEWQSKATYREDVLFKDRLDKSMYQVPLAEDSIPKISIITSFDLLEFPNLLVGVCKAMLTFPRLIDRLFDACTFMFCYLVELLLF